MNKLKNVHFKTEACDYDFDNMVRLVRPNRLETLSEDNGLIYVTGVSLVNEIQSAYQQFILEKYLLGKEDENG